MKVAHFSFSRDKETKKRDGPAVIVLTSDKADVFNLNEIMVNRFKLKLRPFVNKKVDQKQQKEKESIEIETNIENQPKENQSNETQEKENESNDIQQKENESNDIQQKENRNEDQQMEVETQDIQDTSNPMVIVQKSVLSSAEKKKLRNKARKAALKGKKKEQNKTSPKTPDLTKFTISPRSTVQKRNRTPQSPFSIKRGKNGDTPVSTILF